MSRRFGRNQKRALRAELAAARLNAGNGHAGLKIAMERLDHFVDRNNQLMAVIEEVRDVLGKHFSGLDPELLKLCWVPEVFYLSPQENSCVSWPGDTPSAVAVAMHALDVYGAELKVDVLRRSTHAFLRSKEGKLHYAMSAEARAVMSRGELVRRLAVLFGDELARRSPGRKV